MKGRAEGGEGDGGRGTRKSVGFAPAHTESPSCTHPPPHPAHSPPPNTQNTYTHTHTHTHIHTHTPTASSLWCGPAPGFGPLAEPAPKLTPHQPSLSSHPSPAIP